MAGERFAVVDSTERVTEGRFAGTTPHYLRWELARAGAHLVSNPSDADILCVTAISPQEWTRVRATIARVTAGTHRRQRIVLGGQAAMSPAIFDSLIDVACIGEGPRFIKTMVSKGLDAAMTLPNAWVPGEIRDVIPDEDFPWDAPPIMGRDGAVKLFASRGCKKKCLFCQVGWQRAYAEQDRDVVKRAYSAIKARGLRINVVTNDAPSLSFFDELSFQHMSASYSQTVELIRRGDIGVFANKTRSVRFGVESPSTRLRAFVGKPIDTRDLYVLSVRLLNMGIGVKWFLIAGLPGERNEDYDELREVVMRARHDVKKCALHLSFTAFCPDPAAPLCLAPLVDDYHERFRVFEEWFFRRAPTHRIAVFKCQSPAGRLDHAVGSMGCVEADLRRGWLEKDPPNWRIQYPLRHVTRRAYNVYAQKTGLPCSPRE